MSFPTDAVNTWLLDQLDALGWPVRAGQEPGRSVKFTRDGFIPDHPDRLVCLTPGSGPGFLNDEASIDRQSVQVHTRGAAEDPSDAEALAGAIDKALIFAVRPTFGSQLCIAIDRAGGPPSAFQPDRRPRYSYICNYVFTFAAYP